ncbi:hypothetical protein LOTGIDRAFT_124115 [Lottia gigantea]|uniref:Endonuclease/exonuclease/phosphatase domain-containing protein n=1 Tax=Lottia gigantea TaxID=225164 RepID=V3ZZV0_LOTGI|nr:hypothetical protein LOTGIDRAFT_124115 [Lottia gigantea]ESO89907.1 hypothetical protein LOTGIDRAFT_124115 [Lottia gigantea]
MSSKVVQYILLCAVFLYGVVNALKIGSFNIQIFGDSKSKKPEVMEIIGKILVRYDIVLIMEIRDSKKKAIPRLLETVQSHSEGDVFDMIISERIGRTNSKEQYAFLYRKDRGIEVVDSFLYEDGSEVDKTDQFEREPFVVKFKASNAVPDVFSLIGIHVDPDIAVQEISALEDVIDYTMGRTNTANVVVLGDLNADCSYVSKSKMKKLAIRHRSDLYWPIGDDVDTTSGNSDCAYDRFIIRGKEFIKNIVEDSVQVFDYQKHFDLSRELTLKVSDHYPIELELQNLNSPSLGTSIVSHRLSVTGIFFTSVFAARCLSLF